MSKAGRVSAVALLVAMAWAVAPVAEAQPPIRIGATPAQTGAYAATGQNQLRGYQLCVKHMNEKGGVLGRKLDLTLYDDGSDSATAVRLYEKLITQDKVELVLGPYTSAITEAVASVTEKYRMPMVAPNAGKVLSVAVLVALASAVPPVAEAQPPIRIGATPAQTGAYAATGQNQLRGYQLCVKHLNDKGGVLGRKLELVVYDDGSDAATAVRLYEKLVTQDKADLLLGPTSSPIVDAVADVNEKYKMPMVAPGGNATSIYRKGRKFIFMVQAPAEGSLEGLLDLAAKKGLKTVALIHVDDAFGRAVIQGAIELAKKKGLQVVFADAYPQGTTVFRDPGQGPGGEPQRAGRRHALRGRGGHHAPDEGAERESPDGWADGGRGPAQVLRGRGA